MLVRKRLKNNNYNPFLSWVSTYKERQASEPVIITCGANDHLKIPVSVETWLEHLKSPSTFGVRERQKSPSIRERDLKIYEKFWRIANGRGILKQLFEDPDLNEAQIARKMTEAGFNMCREQIRLVRKNWFPKRRTIRTEAAKHKRDVLAAIERHPEWTFERIGRSAGITENRAVEIATAAGIKKPSSQLISPEEHAAREKFLEDAGIEHSSDGRVTSVKRMKARALHMLRKHKYVVSQCKPFLILTSKRVDAGIRVLDHYKIDWKDRDKELWKLIGNSSDSIRNKMKIFTAVGASPELHYLLLKKLDGRLEYYSSDKPLYANLRRAVNERDMTAILTYAAQVAHHTLTYRQFSRRSDYFNLAQDAAVSVLRECACPEKNPAAFLTLMSAAVDVAILNKAKEIAMTSSTWDFSVDGERVKPVNKRDQSKD